MLGAHKITLAEQQMYAQWWSIMCQPDQIEVCRKKTEGQWDKKKKQKKKVY